MLAEKIVKKIFKPPKCIYSLVFRVYTKNTMYIKLTNATPAHKGTPLAIRQDLVVSVHHNTVVREDGTVEAVTFLHCPPHGTWEAQDTFDSVVSQLNNGTAVEPTASKKTIRVKADPA
jgi:Icc-related predicted phosphoesterase